VRVHHQRPHRTHHARVRVHRGRHHAYHGRARVHGSFVIPDYIAHSHAGSYRPYYHGRTYFRPHRHHHAVYYFPVYTPAGYVLQPHSYCGGRLHTGYVAYRGPNFSLSVSF
jgi:hypothetical protein